VQRRSQEEMRFEFNVAGSKGMVVILAGLGAAAKSWLGLAYNGFSVA
jgi:hypothetical protein